MRMRALWNDVVLAESDDTVVVGGGHYLSWTSLNEEYSTEGGPRSVCPWKGMASYVSVSAGGDVDAGAAWGYPSPSIRLSTPSRS